MVRKGIPPPLGHNCSSPTQRHSVSRKTSEGASYNPLIGWWEKESSDVFRITQFMLWVLS
jgi:hypothetical protein